MNGVKLQHFQMKSKGEQFPAFKTLGLSENLILYRKIVDKFNSGKNILPFNLLDKVHQEAEFYSGVDAKNSDFNLSEFLAKQQIYPQENIYLNWGAFDNIDSMSSKDLTKHFKDIWSSGDDLILFDDSLNWMVIIDHHGSVGTLKAA